MKKKTKEYLEKAASANAMMETAAQNSDFMSACVFAARALGLYQLAGDGENVQRVKKLQIKYTIEAEKNLTEHKIEVNGLEEFEIEVNTVIDKMTESDDFLVNLHKILTSNYSVPDFNEAVENSNKVRPITEQIFTPITIGSKGHIKSFDNFNEDWLVENYNIQLRLSVGVLEVAFARLITKEQFTQDNIIAFISGRNLYDSNTLLKIDSSLERAFSHDYFSAIHTLVPLIESCFMHLSNQLGIDTVTMVDGKPVTRDKTLDSRMLAKNEVQKVWGADFCMMMDFFLYASRGFNYRNTLAHGNIDMRECGFTLFVIPLFFILKMSNMVKVTQATGSNPS